MWVRDSLAHPCSTFRRLNLLFASTQKDERPFHGEARPCEALVKPFETPRGASLYKEMMLHPIVRGHRVAEGGGGNSST